MLPALVALLSALGACQPLPRPFAHADDAAPNPLLELKDGVGVTVLDLTGAPEPTARAFVPALIDALLAQNVPAAFSAGNRRSIFVYGEAKARDIGSRRLDVEIVWHLVGPHGRTVGEHRVRARPYASSWASAEANMVEAIADSTAKGIAALLRGKRTDEPRATATSRGVHIGPIEGAPGLDREPFRLAISDALLAGRIRVARHSGPEDLVLGVTLGLGPETGGRRLLRVVWRLTGPDGHEIGQMRQENPVDIAILETEWPRLAGIIAQAAADGLYALVAKGSRAPAKSTRRIGPAQAPFTVAGRIDRVRAPVVPRAPLTGRTRQIAERPR